MKSMGTIALFMIMIVVSAQLCSYTLHSSYDLLIPRILLIYNNSYLKIEVLSDDILHFETAHGAAPRVNTPIYTTPMVALRDFVGPSEYNHNEHGFETAKLRVNFEEKTGCATTFDKARNFLIGTTCPFNLDQAWKGLNLNTLS